MSLLNPGFGEAGSNPLKPGTGLTGKVLPPGQSVGSPVNAAAPAVASYHPDPRVTGMAADMARARQKDMTAGKTFADQYFGQNNPEIANILSTEKARMSGLNAGEVNAMQSQGTAAINSQLGTGLHAINGLNNMNHISGGAAAGAAMPLALNAQNQGAQLANNINLANIQRQNTALGQYQNTVTGERAGALDTMFGTAGLGAADRSGAQQTVLGQDWLDYARGQAAANPGPGGSGGSGPSGPLGPGPAAGGAAVDSFINGNPATKFVNATLFGIPGAAGKFLQGGDAFANTPLDPRSYSNVDLNPGNPSNWRW